MCFVYYTATCKRVCARDNERALKTKRKNKRRKEGGGNRFRSFIVGAIAEELAPGVATAWTDFFPESLTKTILSFCKLHCSTSTSGVRGDGRNKNHFLPPTNTGTATLIFTCLPAFLYVFIYFHRRHDSRCRRTVSVPAQREKRYAICGRRALVYKPTTGIELFLLFNEYTRAVELDPTVIQYRAHGVCRKIPIFKLLHTISVSRLRKTQLTRPKCRKTFFVLNWY